MGNQLKGLEEGGGYEVGDRPGSQTTRRDTQIHKSTRGEKNCPDYISSLLY